MTNIILSSPKLSPFKMRYRLVQLINDEQKQMEDQKEPASDLD